MITSPAHSYPLGRLLRIAAGEDAPAANADGMYYEACEACLTHDLARAKELLLLAAAQIEGDNPERAAWIRSRALAPPSAYSVLADMRAADRG